MTTRPSCLLALDTSSGSCATALWERGKILAERFSIMERGQSEAILPMVLTVLSEAGRQFSDLDAIAVTRGPGSFTGVRIGLAAARGIALACKKPVIGLTIFEVLAKRLQAEQSELRGLALVESGRAEVFAQPFDSAGEALDEPSLVLPEALARSLTGHDWLLTGNAAERTAPTLEAAGVRWRMSHARQPVDAADVACLAASLSLPSRDSAPPSPLYFRAADVSLPSKALLKAARSRT